MVSLSRITIRTVNFSRSRVLNSSLRYKRRNKVRVLATHVINPFSKYKVFTN
jgi:hypothetical protein